MKKKITVGKWDAVEILHDENDYAGYLAAAFEDGDPAIVRGAMADVARARNMAQLSKAAGISRAGLYKALSLDGNPEYSTLQKIVDALGMRLTVVPKGARVSITAA